jgi:hypothetical protein
MRREDRGVAPRHVTGITSLLDMLCHKPRLTFRGQKPFPSFFSRPKRPCGGLWSVGQGMLACTVTTCRTLTNEGGVEFPIEWVELG